MTDMATKLREEAAILPHEVYSFLNPLLIRAAEHIEFLDSYRTGVMAQVKGVNDINASLEKENERLRALLKHADDVVIWEHSPARSGFQEEIEEALGIGVDEQSTPK